ncbi:hypothetical protein ABZW11_17120 [Nonomuraea sp. NPDC004580]|uniref:hypothetical protein n=1 Tax=Nonomuraea sp. NPDC004580 TaxID=3154552 RepID=UPI0033AD3A7D
MTSVAEVFRAERTNARAARAARAPRVPYTVRAALWLARRLPSWAAIRTLLLSVAGFGLLTAAAWTLHMAAGLAVGGISLLVLEALSGGERR